jgi:hypothetical protein
MPQVVVLLLCSVASLLYSPESFAYESDQYRNRTQQVADSLTVMDKQVNNAIARILSRKRPPKTQQKFAAAIFHEIGGYYWADKIERWAAKSPEVEKYDQTRHKSIYRDMPIWATRVNFVFGVGRSFKVNNVMVGSDKFGHFVSIGRKYFRRELRGWSRERILAQGVFAESWLWGYFTTGVFSNADIVSNYEGWRFYQSLFRDDVIDGKSAILGKNSEGYFQQRPFTWADHINPYWDEALNPSYNVKSLNKRLRQSIEKMCPEYHANPEYYTVSNDAALWARYGNIGLKDNRSNQFQVICEQ